MWFSLRYTARRGRTGNPSTLSRYRVLRPVRMRFLSVLLSMTRPLRSRLSDLLLDHFVHVPDPLTLVRLRWTQRSDFGGHLSHLLPVNARHGDLGLLFHRHRDPLRDREDDGMRVSEGELHVLALHVRAIADPL